MLSAGDRAPEFSLPDQDGRTVSSKDLRGKRYILYFYPKDDTPGCTTEARQFNDDLASFDGAQVPVYGVSADDASSHQAFRAKCGLRLPLLTDAGNAVMRAYGAWGERPGRGEGVIRSTFLVGPEGEVQRAWYGVKPDGHAKEVLAALG
ncbi:MAG TPA: peroxiredoxin [Candidatus Limnocylindria bacterium]|nr:peroxiredoxin [Candidatus Limnocylindria bacterium]